MVEPSGDRSGSSKARARGERPDASGLPIHLVEIAVEADVAPPLQLVEVERITTGGGRRSQIPIRQTHSRRAVSRHAIQCRESRPASLAE